MLGVQMTGTAKAGGLGGRPVPVRLPPLVSLVSIGRGRAALEHQHGCHGDTCRY